MDFAALHDATWRAGFRLDWATLLHLSARYPEQVQDWVLRGAENADEGGVEDADVVGRERPAGGVPAGRWSVRCRCWWARCRC
jgi:hypothetical protein